MAKELSTSFELDVEETQSLPAKKEPTPELVVRKAKSTDKKQVQKEDKREIQKEVQQKTESPAPEPIPVEIPQAYLPPAPVKKSTSVYHNTVPVISQPAKGDIALPFGVHIDPTTAAVVGTLTVAAAGTAAATTGIAAPAMSAVKLGIIKAKAAMGLTSKVTIAAGATAAGVAAMVALEKKFSNYESEIEQAKSEVDDISAQLRALDALLDKAAEKK